MGLIAKLIGFITGPKKIDYGEGYFGDDCPLSDYYINEEPDYKRSHMQADRNIAIVNGLREARRWLI